jgi:hypothetical protein
MAGFIPIQVGGLPHHQMVALARKLAVKIEGFDEHIDAVVAACGQSPLALRHAISIFRHKVSTPLADLVKQLKTSRLRFLEPVERILTVSYRSLQPKQQRAWRSMSVFDASFTNEAALAILKLTSDAKNVARELLDELHGSSRIESLSRERFVLHDLEREFLRKKLRRGEWQALQWQQLTYFKKVLKQMCDSRDPFTANKLNMELLEIGWPELAPILPDLEGAFTRRFKFPRDD